MCVQEWILFFSCITQKRKGEKSKEGGEEEKGDVWADVAPTMRFHGNTNAAPQSTTASLDNRICTLSLPLFYINVSKREREESHDVCSPCSLPARLLARPRYMHGWTTAPATVDPPAHQYIKPYSHLLSFSLDLCTFGLFRLDWYIFIPVSSFVFVFIRLSNVYAC